MANGQNRRLGRASLLGATLIWGSSFIILKSTLDSVPTLWVLALRFTGAAALMALIGWKELKQLDLQYLKKGAVLGTALFAAYTLQTFGLEYTTPGKNAFLTATYCVLVPFMWWAFTKKRPDAYNLGAALVCIIGMALVSLDGDLSLGLGDGLTICCGIFYALHIILTSRAVEGRSPVLLSMVQFAVAGLWCWVTAPMVSAFPSGVPASAWWSIAYLCFMCTGICFLLQTNDRAEAHDPADGVHHPHAGIGIRHAALRHFLPRAAEPQDPHGLCADIHSCAHLGDEAELHKDKGPGVIKQDIKRKLTALQRHELPFLL